MKAQRAAETLRSRAVELEKRSSDEDLALMVALLTACGHVERASGRLVEAEVTYGEALSYLERCPSEAQARRAANLWTCRGLALLSGGSAAEWTSSIQCFDQSISIREQRDDERTDRWGLSAAWMNRADALGKIGGEPNLRDALEALDTAIVQLDQLDPAASPGIRSRIALAWMNRGNTLARLTLDYSAHREADSISAYDRAVEVLRAGQDSGLPEPKRMLAVALSNRGRAKAQLSDAQDTLPAEKDALESLSLIVPEDLVDPNMMTLMLTNRVTLCHLIERSDRRLERHAELTDIVEDGLQLTFPYVARFPEPLEALVGQLFMMGASTYANHLPTFLEEYLLDFLDPDRSAENLASSKSCQEAAVRVLWIAIAQLQDLGFGAGEEREQRLEQLFQWQQCRERLAEIRAERFPQSD